MRMYRVFISLTLGGILSGAAVADEKIITLHVPDMTCTACVTNVKRALSRLEGIKKVVVDTNRLEAVVTFDDARTSSDAIIDVTGIAGYSASIVR